MAWLGTVSFNQLSKYNFGDLNRENENVEYLRDILLQIGFTPVLTYPIVKDRTRLSFPTVSAINNLRQNIKDLVDSYPLAKNTIESVGPAVGTYYSGEESMIFGAASVTTIDINPARKQIFDFNNANQLELTLALLYEMITQAVYNFSYSGTFYSGEEGLIY